ncbi:MAG TPA: leucine zipper domain-containing protein [Actinomycetales bacterium]|nr:leucine zipper domain-containing protein [Actinomycetales bacterium]
MDPLFAAAVAAYVHGEEFKVAVKCRELGVSRERFYKYVARFKAEGVDGFYPRSRRPLTSPTRLPVAVEDALVQIRKAEEGAGWDYGADAVRLVLQTQPARWPSDRPVPARSTINRVFDDRGQLPKMPQRAPRRRWRRFQRDRVNELWQYDGFQWRLADGSTLVVLHLNDDCSRLDLALQVARSENSNEVWQTFCVAADRYGLPAQVLSDNGTAFSGRRRGWTAAFEANLADLSVRPITSRVNHPQTCGKNERAHQRVLKWLRRQPRAADAATLQAQLDAYRAAYNQRPNQVLAGLSPQQRYDLGPRIGPTLPGKLQPPLHLTRHTVSATGSIGVDDTLIGLGRRHAHAPAIAFRRGDLVSIFIHDQLIRTLVIDRNRHYQPQGD